MCQFLSASLCQGWLKCDERCCRELGYSYICIKGQTSLHMEGGLGQQHVSLLLSVVIVIFTRAVQIYSEVAFLNLIVPLRLSATMPVPVYSSARIPCWILTVSSQHLHH